MNKKTSNPHKKVRHTWERSPVEKPHSTKKGKKGYNRKQIKDETQKQQNEDSP
ncbi:hypothetical protein K8I31_15270 [bacterium]|nr:hypothetical protein [bacterium]